MLQNLHKSNFGMKDTAIFMSKPYVSMTCESILNPQFHTDPLQFNTRTTPFQYPKSLSSTHLSVLHLKPLSSTPKPRCSTHPSVPQQKLLSSTHLNWGVFGVELRRFWCGTDGVFHVELRSVLNLAVFSVELRSVLNWGVFGVELRGFWCGVEGFWGLIRVNSDKNNFLFFFCTVNGYLKLKDNFSKAS